MQIRVIRESEVLKTTWFALIEALQSVAETELEVLAVLGNMVDEGRISFPVEDGLAA